jgi:GTP-binding protein
MSKETTSTSDTYRINPMYRQAVFVCSAFKLQQAPKDTIREVAFAGRSNAGKSSAINAITGNRKLARTSKVPGRTQSINFFSLSENRMLVDLPGYGYAKVSEKIKLQWQDLLQRYLTQRSSLHGLILVMDIRHPLTEFDMQMLGWCHHNNLPVHVLLTKSDKLNRGPAHNVLHKVSRTLDEQGFAATVQLFSAQASVGVEQVHAVLDQWLDLP